MTKIGIFLEALSFLFLSPELFGIDDISAIQRKVFAFTKQSAQHTLGIFLAATKRGIPEIVNKVFYWLTWPQSKVLLAGNEKAPITYDWINSVEKSFPIALLNLFLLWLPGILFIRSCFINGILFFNSAYPIQLIMSESLDFVYNVLSYFIIGIIFCYFAVAHTLATITWHLNAIAALLRNDRERRLLAILGVWLFIFASFMQFLAA